MGPAYVVGARRTPVVPRGGVFCDVELFRLGVAPAVAALADAGIAADSVDEVIIGNALGPGGNPARSIALAAGLPERAAGLTIDRQCCSGLDALLLARALVVSGSADVVLAGGVESYSRRSYRNRPDATAGQPDPFEQAPFTPWPERDPHMAEAASELAGKLGISRRQQDDWAVESHRKAGLLQVRKRQEIAALPGIDCDFDSYARRLTRRVCERARMVHGSISTANASVAADAGAVCVVVSARVMRRMDCPAIRMLAGSTVGGDPELPGLAPIGAIRMALEQAGLTVSDISVAEIMEAFAVQAIACVEEAGISPAVVNLGGGSLARGHPIGASGAILAVRLFHELQFRKARRGIAAIAAAGGIGTAALFENPVADV